MKLVFGNLMVVMSILLMNACAVEKKVSEQMVFEIPLKNNGQGGFQWTFRPIPEIKVIDSFETDALNESQFSEFTKHYKLKGLKKGRYTLEFIKVRSFQPDLILKENIKKIRIRIKKAPKNAIN